jgi:hypothetical protein
MHGTLILKGKSFLIIKSALRKAILAGQGKNIYVPIAHWLVDIRILYYNYTWYKVEESLFTPLLRKISNR